MNMLANQFFGLMPHHVTRRAMAYSSVDSVDSTDSASDVVAGIQEGTVNKEGSNIHLVISTKKTVEENGVKSTGGIVKGTNGFTHHVTDPNSVSEQSRLQFLRGDKTQSRSDLAPVQEIARLLGHDTVIYYTRKNQGKEPKPVNSHAETLRRTVDYLSDKHQILFAGMIKKLQVGEGSAACRSFVTIADEMFADRLYNWGRIVTLYAFAACLAKHCSERNLGDEWVEKIGEAVGNYVADHLSEWIVKQGGWDDLDKFFPERENFETKIWRGLFYTMLGLGALATTMAAVR